MSYGARERIVALVIIGMVMVLAVGGIILLPVFDEATPDSLDNIATAGFLALIGFFTQGPKPEVQDVRTINPDEGVRQVYVSDYSPEALAALADASAPQVRKTRKRAAPAVVVDPPPIEEGHV